MAEQGGVFQSGSVPDNYRLRLEPVIFGPWADRLAAAVGVRAGDRVLDVAAGTGVVARVAARLAGPTGSVVASDISPAMLAYTHVGADPGGAPIETVECSATALTVDDGAFDVVVCQQGFPFIPDRAAAAREFKRALRPGGRAGASVWLLGAPLDPFETYATVLSGLGVPEPFPEAYDFTGFQMSEAEVAGAFESGGFLDVQTEVQDHAPPWASPEDAAAGVLGTPYAPALANVDESRRAEVMAALVEAFTATGGGLRAHTQRAVIGIGIA